MGTYFAMLTCRNSEKCIAESLISLKEQTIAPKYVIVIDHGSSDKTLKKLRKIQIEWGNSQFFIITNPNLEYNIGRVSSDWNKAIRFAHERNFEQTYYHLISSDDIVFEKKYAEKIIANMDSDPDIAVASGDFGKNISVIPHSFGRVVRNFFFMKNHGLYPEKMGYESLLLYTAAQAGYKYTVFPHVRFRHTRITGKDRNFYEFGASMRKLGYPPLSVIHQYLSNFASGKSI